MFGSTVLDVAIGLIFVFLLLSLICSAASELIELALKKRARDLEEGIAELIGDPDNTTEFMRGIYDHGLVNGLYRGRYQPGSSNLPSYIPARNFALAILDVRAQVTSAIAGGQEAAPGIARLMPANVQSAFRAFEKEAAGDAIQLQASIEDWYNSAMDRVSGWYKRRTQIFILAMGIAIAVAVNADSIEITQRLSSDASLRQGIVALAEATAKKPDGTNDKTRPEEAIRTELKTLDALGLPLGWPANNEPWSFARAMYALEHHWMGWLLTALAVSLGAPFWFDLLNKIIVVRSTVKPHEKSREEGSKDAARAPAPEVAEDSAKG